VYTGKAFSLYQSEKYFKKTKEGTDQGTSVCKDKYREKKSSGYLPRNKSFEQNIPEYLCKTETICPFIWTHLASVTLRP
jgi:hypothetical protein